MKLAIDDMLAHSFCISIDVKKYALFTKLFQQNDLLPVPQMMLGLRLALNNQLKSIPQLNANDQHLKKHLSAMMSHRMIVSFAKAMDFPYVCIFEDDAVPRVNVKQMMSSLLDDVPDDIDILILGNSVTFESSSYNEALVIPKKTWGLQSYVVFKSNYDTFLNNIDANTNIGLAGYGKHVYLAKKQLFIQYSSGKDTCISKGTGFLHQDFSKEFLNNEFGPQLSAIHA